MNFIKKSLWALFAILALSYQPAQAMEWKEGSTTFPKSIQALIVKELLMVDRLQENKSFEDVCRNLSGVCKFWHTTIKQNVKNWVCKYFMIKEKNKDNFWQYFNGKLFFKTDGVYLFFSAVPNLFNGTLDLSKCRDVGKRMSFHLGFPTKDKEFAQKIQAWFFF